MKTKRISIGGDNKTKKQRIFTGTKKFRRILLRTDESDDLSNEIQQQKSNRRKTCHTFRNQNQSRSTNWLKDTLVANNRELANALEDAQIDGKNARQKTLELQKQRQNEQLALTKKINCLQNDLQLVTQQYGNEVKKTHQARERFAEVHKLLQETIKLLLEGTKRLTTAMMLVSNSNSNKATEPIIVQQTPLNAKDTPIPQTSTCENTPPPDSQVVEPIHMQTFDSAIDSLVTPSIASVRAFPPDTPSTRSAVKKNGGFANEVEVQHTTEKKNKSRRRRSKVVKEKCSVEGHGKQKVPALNDNQEEPMEISETHPLLDVTESSAQNKDDKILFAEPKMDEFAAKDMLLSSTESEAKPATTTSTTEATSCFETRICFSSKGKRSKNGSDCVLAEGSKEKDLESTSSKSHRRKSTRHEPYKKAQSRRQSQKEMNKISSPSNIEPQNSKVDRAFKNEHLTQVSNGRRTCEAKWDIAQVENHTGSGVEANDERYYTKHKRRSTHGVCYTEPALNSKLRRGDPFTDSSLYTRLPVNKKTRKSTPIAVMKRKNRRSALVDLTNVSINEEDEFVMVD